MRPRRPWGAAICETVATFVSSWEVQRKDVLRGSKEASPSPGGSDLRNCRHCRGLLGGPAEGCPTRITTRPRGALGGSICETVATFVGSWKVQRRGALCGSPLDLAVPWGAAICESVAFFSVGFREGQRSDALRRSPIDLAVPWKAAICESVAIFVGSWEGQRSDVLRGSQL